MATKVIIFDFDGTIADTVDALVSIANSLAVEFSYAPINPEELVILKNLTSREIFKYSGIPLFKIPFLLKKVKRELRNKIPELKPIEGIPEALLELKENGSRLGIITSNSKGNVKEFLKINNLDNFFEFVHTGVTIFGKTTIINNVLKQKQIKTSPPSKILQRIKNTSYITESSICCLRNTRSYTTFYIYRFQTKQN